MPLTPDAPTSPTRHLAAQGEETLRTYQHGIGGGACSTGSRRALRSLSRSLGRSDCQRPSRGRTRMDAAPLRGTKIVVTGVTGQVAEPLACALAARQRGVSGRPGSTTPRPVVAWRPPGSSAWSSTCWRASPGASRRRRLRPELRCHQDQRLGRRSAGQLRWVGLVDGAPSRRPRLPALFDHGGLQAHGSPRLRRGRSPGRQPRGVALPADLQHLQDRRRGDGAVGRPAFRASHDDHPAVGSLRRPGRLARGAPAHDDQRFGDPGPRGRPERLPPTARATTSSACCRRSSKRHRCRPPWSTGAGARR